MIYLGERSCVFDKNVYFAGFSAMFFMYFLGLDAL